MSAEETDQTKYMNDIGMFHRLQDARSSLLDGGQPLDRRIESASLQILPLRSEDLPGKYRDELKWVQDNIPSDSGGPDGNNGGSADAYVRRSIQFLDAVLRWRTENR